jgi:mannose-6-phosphate isomerase-like protein (cupin superfamily)
MKRSSFFRLTLSAIAGLSLPFSSYARRRSGKKVDKGFFVPAGKDRFDKSISLFEGDTFYTKVSTKDTDGEIYMFESSRVKKGGPPLHVHAEQDEWWYVLAGEFLIKVGDQLFTAKAGDSVFGPRKVPHAFAKISEEEGRLLMFFTPAGKMEASFIARSQGVTDNMTQEQRNAFSKEYGVEVVGPPLTFLKR